MVSGFTRCACAAAIVTAAVFATVAPAQAKSLYTGATDSGGSVRIAVSPAKELYIKIKRVRLDCSNGGHSYAHTYAAVRSWKRTHVRDDGRFLHTEKDAGHWGKVVWHSSTVLSGRISGDSATGHYRYTTVARNGLSCEGDDQWTATRAN